MDDWGGLLTFTLQVLSLLFVSFNHKEQGTGNRDRESAVVVSLLFRSFVVRP